MLTGSISSYEKLYTNIVRLESMGFLAASNLATVRPSSDDWEAKKPDAHAEVECAPIEGLARYDGVSCLHARCA